MDRELMDDTILRSADIDALELILGGHLPLDEFTDFAVDLPKFLGNFTAQILLDLDDLQFDFGDFPAYLRAGGNGLGKLTFEASCLALQNRKPVHLNKVLLPKKPDPHQLSLDQLDLFPLGLLKTAVSASFLIELNDPLTKLRFLALASSASQF